MHDYHPAPDLLNGRVILVTGAGDGIGKAAALAFAAHGASVVLVGRTESKLEGVYDAIVDAGQPQPALCPLNLAATGPHDSERLALTLDREFGRLDGLLHNAAELGDLTPIEHYDPETWERVLRVNVHAPFLLTRACLPLLRRSADASVVFTTADVGRRGRAYWGAYAVAAFALEGLMQVLADELEGSSPVRVNSLDPGHVHTAWYTRSYPGRDPTQLPGPVDIMGSYLYLMGPDSRGVTGQALVAQASRG